MQTEPTIDPTDARVPASPEQHEIDVVVARLARRQASGCEVIERAAILAEGTRSGAILAWLTSHGWEAEKAPGVPSGGGRGGLHNERAREDDRAGSRPPQRYVRWPAA